MAYVLKSGYIEILDVAAEERTGECKASETLKQGMAVSKGRDANGNPVVSKASGAALHEVFVVKRYSQDEVAALYSGYSEPAIVAGERVVTLGKGRIATDQYVGNISSYQVADSLEIGTGANAGLFQNYGATPTGKPIARVVGKDYNKLIVDIL